MQNKLDKFENNLKTIVEDYMPNYSSKAWSRLDSSLPISFAKWYMAASSVVIIGALLIAYQYINTDKQISNNYPERITESINLNLPNIVESEVLQVDSNEKENIYVDHCISSIEESDNPIVEDEILVLEVDEKTIEVKTDIEDLLEKELLVEADPDLGIIVDQIQKEPVIYLSTHNACLPLLLEVAVHDLPLDAIVSWTISDGYKTQLNKFKHSFSKPGLYKIIAEIQVSGKMILLKDELFINKSPIVNFAYYENNGQIDVENKSKNYVDLSWTFLGGDSKEENPIFELQYSGVYNIKLAVENEYGCVSSLSKSIIYKLDHHIFAPNAFSPDGDGVNDAFLIKYKSRDGYKYTFQIFNSKGQKLFETQNKYLAWNAENINLNIHHEKFTWRLIITDPRGVTETYKDFFVNISQ